MIYDIRPIAAPVRRHMDLELRALRARDVWAFVTAVWPLLDRVLVRWVAFLTPEIPAAKGKETFLRITLASAMQTAREIRKQPQNEFDARDLYVEIIRSFLTQAPQLSRLSVTVDGNLPWTPLDGPLGLFTDLTAPVKARWSKSPIHDIELVEQAILDVISDEMTRPLTDHLLPQIRAAA